MNPLRKALSEFGLRHFDKCAEICTEILEKQPLDQAVWCLKMRALTKRVYVDDLDSDELLMEDALEENIIASAPRPGTSLRTAAVQTSSTMTVRPRTATGRPISGVVRPGTQLRPGTVLDRLKTARPMTNQSARAIRLGSAAIFSQKDGPFIQVSRINFAKYGKDACVSKPLFEYLFYHEGNVRAAMDLAVQATKFHESKDWWWRVQLAKCYNALNLIRDAEKHLKSAVELQPRVETFLRLVQISIRLDQPLGALEVCKNALEVFANDVSIQVEVARLYEGLGDAQSSIKHYRNVVAEDAMNTEAIACIGVYHFYNNQPEMALRYYRRLLAMGVYSAELYTNLGICCLYSQQLDLTLACFQRAMDLATDPLLKAEIWYNLSHVAIAAGDIELAMQCLNVCLTADSNHACAFNNLAVLQYKLGRSNLAKAYFATAKSLQPNMDEPQKNLQLLEERSSLI